MPIVEALTPYDSMIVINEAPLARDLAFATKGAIPNAFRMRKLYPAVSCEGILWFVESQLSHPRRIPVASFRALRFRSAGDLQADVLLGSDKERDQRPPT